MKKYLRLILATIVIICFVGCDFNPKESKEWVDYELAPSKIKNSGEVFFKGQMSNGVKYSVFADEHIDKDASFYQVLLYQDFGWKLKFDNLWIATRNSREIKLAHIYINLRRGAAVYYYADGNYSVFKVNLK